MNDFINKIVISQNDIAKALQKIVKCRGPSAPSKQFKISHTISQYFVIISSKNVTRVQNLH